MLTHRLVTWTRFSGMITLGPPTIHPCLLKHLLTQLLLFSITPRGELCGPKPTKFMAQHNQLILTRCLSMELYKTMTSKETMQTSTLHLRWLLSQWFQVTYKTCSSQELITLRFMQSIFTSEENHGLLLWIMWFQSTLRITELFHTFLTTLGITCGLLFFTKPWPKSMAVIATLVIN